MHDLIFIESLRKLRDDSLTVKYDQYKRLEEQCKEYESYPMYEQHPSSSTTYMGIAIMNLSLMYLLSNEDKYLQEAKRFMLCVCNWGVWGNAHLVNVDLSASWILFGLSLGYDWLKNDLDAETKKKVYDKLIIQSKYIYEYKVTQTSGWPVNYFQNHNWINLCGLACCGYALSKDGFNLANEYITIAKENFEIVYNNLPDDGSNYEGVVYWRYGGMWLFVYADLLKNEEGIDYFKSCNYLKETVYYRIYSSSSNFDKQMNFGDCHDRYSGHCLAVYYKVASEYNNGFAQKYAEIVKNKYLYKEQVKSRVKPGILAEAAFEYLWYNPEVKTKELTSLPLVKYFEDLGLICARSSFNENSIVFNYKCSTPGGKKQWKFGVEYYKNHKQNIMSLSHHHPDNNSFILNYDDTYFAIDDGYNRNIMPYHHNVLLVDGEMTEIVNKNDIYMDSIKSILADDPMFDLSSYCGEIEYFNTDEKLTFFKGESKGIYKRSLKMNHVERFILTNQLDYLIMIDNLESEIPHQYTNVFNSDSFPKKLSDNLSVYTHLNQELNKYMYSNKDIYVSNEMHEVKSVMTTQEPDKYCLTRLYSNNTNSVNKEHKQQFYSIYTLHNKSKQLYDVKYDNDCICVSKIRGYKDYLILTNNYKSIETDAEMIYLRVFRGIIQKYAIINGTYFRINGNLIYQNKEKTCFIGGKINELFK